MSEEKELLYRYLDKLFRNYPNIEIKDVKSLTKLREEFGIGKYRNIDCVDEYLKRKFGASRGNTIKQKLWPKKSIALNQSKEDKLFEILNKTQMKNYYPNNIFKISSLTELKALIKVRRTTITNWVKQFLEIKYNLIKGEELFNKIWRSRKQSSYIAITYHYLKDFVKNRYGPLITTEEAFNSMKEIPTSRYIQIRCKRKHDFKALVLHILYHHQWCPKCNEYFCQKILCLYMEEIFQAKFPETSLNRAFGISYHEGGKLRFDGYNGNIHIAGKILRIAFEYDGIQHDGFPNSFHKTIEEFDRQKENDKKKNKKAKQYSTVLIKLKEINGFNSETICNF